MIFLNPFDQYAHLQTQIHPDIFIIFGGGHFGFNALKQLHDRGICFIVDRNSLPKKDAEQMNLIQIQSNDLNSFNFSAEDHSSYFLQGSVHELHNLMERIVPQYLIPTAPIHVMAEYIKDIIGRMIPKIEINPESITELINSLSPFPKNLHILPSTDQKLYLSFAKFEEKCPETCISPVDYCPIFKRKKNQPLSAFVTQKLGSDPRFLHFISEQLGPGIGGIRTTMIFDELIRFGKVITQWISNPNNQKLFVTIATSCNCHGVVEQICIEK